MEISSHPASPEPVKLNSSQELVVPIPQRTIVGPFVIVTPPPRDPNVPYTEPPITPEDLDAANTRLFVKGLSPDLHDYSHLFRVFRTFGRIRMLALNTKRHNALVEYADKDSANTAKRDCKLIGVPNGRVYTIKMFWGKHINREPPVKTRPPDFQQQLDRMKQVHLIQTVVTPNKDIYELPLPLKRIEKHCKEPVLIPSKIANSPATPSTPLELGKLTPTTPQFGRFSTGSSVGPNSTPSRGSGRNGNGSGNPLSPSSPFSRSSPSNTITTRRTQHSNTHINSSLPSAGRGTISHGSNSSNWRSSSNVVVPNHSSMVGESNMTSPSPMKANSKSCIASNPSIESENSRSFKSFPTSTPPPQSVPRLSSSSPSYVPSMFSPSPPMQNRNIIQQQIQEFDEFRLSQSDCSIPKPTVGSQTYAIIAPATVYSSTNSMRYPQTPHQTMTAASTLVEDVSFKHFDRTVGSPTTKARNSTSDSPHFLHTSQQLKPAQSKSSHVGIGLVPAASVSSLHAPRSQYDLLQQQHLLQQQQQQNTFLMQQLHWQTNQSSLPSQVVDFSLSDSQLYLHDEPSNIFMQSSYSQTARTSPFATFDVSSPSMISALNASSTPKSPTKYLRTSVQSPSQQFLATPGYFDLKEEPSFARESKDPEISVLSFSNLFGHSLLDDLMNEEDDYFDSRSTQWNNQPVDLVDSNQVNMGDQTFRSLTPPPGLIIDSSSQDLSPITSIHSSYASLPSYNSSSADMSILYNHAEGSRLHSSAADIVTFMDPADVWSVDEIAISPISKVDSTLDAPKALKQAAVQRPAARSWLSVAAKAVSLDSISYKGKENDVEGAV